MELRFMSGNADVQVGDALVTSGIDGVYPPGLPVATVAQRGAARRLRLRPHPAGAGRRADAVRHVLVLESVAVRCSPVPPSPEPADGRAGRPGRPPSGDCAMIMPRGTDQLLLPVNPLFIGFTLLVALGFNLLPGVATRPLPDLLALVLVFWNVHQPRRVGWAWPSLFGLLMDVHEGAVLGSTRWPTRC
jgi:hypothetical protein